MSGSRDCLESEVAWLEGILGAGTSSGHRADVVRLDLLEAAILIDGEVSILVTKEPEVVHVVESDYIWSGGDG